MGTFRWNPDFATGLEEVDAQHRGMVELIGGLSARIERADLDPDTLAPMFTDLQRYAEEHFLTEAKILAEFSVDARHVDQHRNEHTYFLGQIEDMIQRFSSRSGATALQLLDFLIHWLTYHLLGTDQSMARQVKAIRAGRAPQEAFLEAERGINPATATLLQSLQALFRVLSLRNRELTELTATLERRVLARTAALSAANAELRQAVAQVEQMAMTDFLTGLPNRRQAMDRLAQCWALSVRHDHPLATLLLDADSFKEVNDAHGHHAGDEVLKALAAALRASVRAGDEVYRFGGDEFLVIAPETSLEGALSLGERIRSSVARLRVPAGSGAWQGSVSVGVAARGPGNADIDALLRAADHGVYAAKRAGRNAVRAGTADATIPEPCG